MMVNLYSECVANENGEETDEAWYALDTGGAFKHRDHEISTINIIFRRMQKGIDDYTWAENVTIEEAEAIKIAFANSKSCSCGISTREQHVIDRSQVTGLFARRLKYRRLLDLSGDGISTHKQKFTASLKQNATDSVAFCLHFAG